ncbi:hypothetical protein D7Z96_13785 [Pseudarthrobacter phenanthrenivorans]|uniref:Uncharacterized protein n=2 Tax=Pseudarthrobacter phenanthrenivorans TaxID=361575 RepID=A0A3B0FR02_PSEPS|nr:hypothetical protein Asphe3_04570 [Pseudarthrobacter phenanthrenivorans Sphe3]RKO22275.1 hypothetical protein D7Z96_13785 [Pseudarthrobacter phenanthrenivorans]
MTATCWIGTVLEAVIPDIIAVDAVITCCIIAGTVRPAAIAKGRIPGSRARSSCRRITRGAARARAIAAAAIAPAPLDVRVNFIRFPGPLIYVIPKRPGLGSLLVGLLAQPGGLHLRLLRISPGARRLGLALARIQFPVLGFAADLSGLLAVGIVPLLLNSLAPTP